MLSQSVSLPETSRILYLEENCATLNDIISAATNSQKLSSASAKSFSFSRKSLELLNGKATPPTLLCRSFLFYFCKKSSKYRKFPVSLTLRLYFKTHLNRTQLTSIPHDIRHFTLSNIKQKRFVQLHARPILVSFSFSRIKFFHSGEMRYFLAWRGFSNSEFSVIAPKIVGLLIAFPGFSFR